MSRTREITDIEVARNFFCISYEDYDTGWKVTYEISERINEIQAIREHWTKLCKTQSYLITFNGNHYDIPMMLYLMSLDPNDDYENTLYKLYKFSKFIIETDFWWDDDNLKRFKYPRGILSVDLYLYWSKMLRLSKKISLKSLGIQLKYDTVQELPYNPDEEIPVDKFDEVIHYNRVHDLNITKLLTVALKKDIELRKKIKADTKLSTLSWDAPKLGSELLLQDYCKVTGKDPGKVKDEKYYPGHSLPLPDIKFETEAFQDLYKAMCEANRDFSRDVVFIEGNTRIKLAYGIGGLHSVNNNEVYKTTDEELVYTSDVSSMYPNLIINYSCVRDPIVLNLYKQIKSERMIAKKAGDKYKDTSLKLILNSFSKKL